MAIASIRKTIIAVAAFLVLGAGAVSVRAQESMPAGVDNSKLKYFPPLINQIGGSCAQASYIGYMFTYEMNRLLDRDASASKDYQFSYLYTWNFINDGKDEGSLGTGYSDSDVLLIADLRAGNAFCARKINYFAEFI